MPTCSGLSILVYGAKKDFPMGRTWQSLIGSQSALSTQGKGPTYSRYSRSFPSPSSFARVGRTMFETPLNSAKHVSWIKENGQKVVALAQYMLALGFLLLETGVTKHVMQTCHVRFTFNKIFSMKLFSLPMVVVLCGSYLVHWRQTANCHILSPSKDEGIRSVLHFRPILFFFSLT